MKEIKRNPCITFPCFTHEQVKEINKKIKENIFQEEAKSQFGTSTKKGNFFHVPCEPLMDLLHPWLFHCQQINREVFGYDIYWDFHLESLNYNVYGTGDEYSWHIDGNTNPHVPIDMKLTCLLNLSEEPYEGGEFYTINDEEKVKFDSGMGLILNSLVAHKVTPVTEGQRITLTYWAHGPAWK